MKNKHLKTSLIILVFVNVALLCFIYIVKTNVIPRFQNIFRKQAPSVTKITEDKIEEQYPRETPFYFGEKPMPSDLVQDVVDPTTKKRIYVGPNNLYQFQYPSNWGRIVEEVQPGVSHTEEFFKMGINPEFRGSDGEGNYSLWTSLTYKDKASLEDHREFYGTRLKEQPSYITIGGRKALKVYAIYYVKPTDDTTLNIVTTYKGKDLFDSFHFPNQLSK